MNPSNLAVVNASAATGPSDPILRSADIVIHQAEGRRRPIFVIRTWPGEIAHYEALAQALGSDQPLYSIAPPDFETLEAFPQSTDDWVDFLRPRIEALEHKGDFIFAGWSFGGVMALELAEALSLAGSPVPRVIMIDSRMPKYRPDTKPGAKMPTRLRRFGKHLIEYSEIESRRERLAYAAHRLDPFRKIRKDRARKKRRAESLQQSQADTPLENESSRPAVKAGPRAVVTRHTRERMSFLKRTIHVAYLKYKRHDTRLPITLLRTEESFRKSGQDPSLGWAPFVRGRFAVDAIGGTHDTVFEPEHLPQLAQQIERALRDCEPGESSSLLGQPNYRSPTA